MPVSLTDRILHVEHYLSISGHPGEGRMYQTIQKNIFLLHMANGSYQTVSICATFPRSREQTKRKRQYQLFPAAGPLQSIAIDILGLLPETKNGNVFIIEMTDRYFKLRRPISTPKTTAMHVANLFFDH